MKRTINRTMFYNADPDIFESAEWLRLNMTSAEKLVWEKLRKKQLGVRFKPQHPIGRFIADFYCHRHKLVIEIDGKIHENQKEYDEGREAEMERLGITIIRFRNEEVFQDLDSVIERIKKLL
ncbi:MAG: endonuclease domain-containing protein [Bacteroidales bacterium]|nr:endonuclease domain-containing protein [Bacteroidales bacterium]